MFRKLGDLLRSLFGDSLARIMKGAGIAVFTTAATVPLVDGAFRAVANSVNGMPGDILAIAQIAGFGIVLSSVASAYLTMAALKANRWWFTR